MRFRFIAGLCWLVCMMGFSGSSLEDPSLRLLQSGQRTSIRGLSVVDGQVAWVSGSNGWVARTSDRGKTWKWMQVPGYEQVDFRDVEAFSDREAVLLGIASPLFILRTSDGGQSWQLVHRDDRPEIFFDGMDFSLDGRYGIAFGDAIDGRMPLLRTSDSGHTWQDITQEADLRIVDGEAGFAASGTSIRMVETAVSGHAGAVDATFPGRIYLGTGGTRSRLLVSDDFGLSWSSYPCPILQGSASAGIFSIAFRDGLHGVAVGGDYQDDLNKDRAVFLTSDGGRNWLSPQIGTSGFRSAVEYLSPERLIACGTSGVDISLDGGQNWQQLSGESYHAVRKAKNGSWVLLAGSGGRIAELIP